MFWLYGQENSYLRIRWITLILQLFMLLMLVDSLVLHIIYIVDVQNFRWAITPVTPRCTIPARQHYSTCMY